MAQTGHAALVTGGSGGIGRAIALRLAKDGYHVIVHFHAQADSAGAVAGQIVGEGGSAELCQFDVTDRDAVSSAMEGLLSRHTLHVAVLCAGVHKDEAMVFMTGEQWDEVLETNLVSFFAVVKPIVKQMALNRTGRIIAISSTSGEAGMRGQVNYSAAKAGIIGAVKALALECAKRGVLVNAISPGFIDTEMLTGMPKADIIGKIPLNRLGTPREVAAAASFLASPDSSYITGQVLRVNGGSYM
ncbi:MAG TPA: 3-oxoacyl-ACP reductase FabG [Chitinivibrionales bacterium]